MEDIKQVKVGDYIKTTNPLIMVNEKMIPKMEAAQIIFVGEEMIRVEIKKAPKEAYEYSQTDIYTEYTKGILPHVTKLTEKEVQELEEYLCMKEL